MKTLETLFGLQVKTSRFAPPGEIWIILPQEGPDEKAVLDALLVAANHRGLTGA